MSGVATAIAGAAIVGSITSSKASKSATESSEKGAAAAAAETRRAADEARSDLFKLFPAAQQSVGLGFQGALDVFGQSLPAQVDVFQQGNVGAQQQLLAGLPLFQNAILGGNIDFSQLQPTQIQTPDLSFFQQQLPQFVDPFAVQPQDQTVNQNTRFQGFNNSLGSGVSSVSGVRRRINDKRIRN